MNPVLRTTAAIVLAAAPAFAAQQAETPRPTPAASTTSDYVTTTGIKSQIFEVRHRDPAALVAVLRPLGSGFAGATVAYSNEFRTLSVRDWPENIATIGEAIKRLDVAE